MLLAACFTGGCAGGLVIVGRAVGAGVTVGRTVGTGVIVVVGTGEVVYHVLDAVGSIVDHVGSGIACVTDRIAYVVHQGIIVISVPGCHVVDVIIVVDTAGCVVVCDVLGRTVGRASQLRLYRILW